MPDWILHVDLDQFLAAVEVLRRPELAGRPVVVGGDGDPSRPRQVVATASYEARAFGVTSGMPLGLAARRCPDAVFLPSDRPAYEAASARVMATLRSFPVVVEVWGWDEAFVGAHTDDPETLARAVQWRVLTWTRACRARSGSARRSCRPRRRPASPSRAASPGSPGRAWIDDDGRPAGHRALGHRRAHRRPAGRRRDPHRAELAQADHHELARRFGPTIGPHLKVLGLGGGDATGRGRAARARSRSREVTFEHDLTDPAELDQHLARLATEVTESVVAEGRRVTHVAVKVRTPRSSPVRRSASSRQRRPTRPRSSASPAVVLDRFELTRPVRLLGVRVVLEPPG